MIKMPVSRNKLDFGVISLAFTVVLFCWHSTSTSYAMSIHEAGSDDHNKKTHAASGLEEMEMSHSLEEDRATKLQSFDAGEDEEDVYVGSDRKTSPSKRRRGSNKRRLPTNRFHKRRADSADESEEDAFDRNLREPRLRINENTEVHLGNSRSRRSVNSASTTDREVQQFKDRNIGRSLFGLVKRNAASFGLINHDLGVLAERLAMRQRQQDYENLRNKLLEIGKRSEPFYDSTPGNYHGTQSINNDIGVLAERAAMSVMQENHKNLRNKLLELGKRSEPFYNSTSGKFLGKLSINNDIGVLAERMAMQQRQDEHDDLRRRLIELGKRSYPPMDGEPFVIDSNPYSDIAF